MKPVTYLMCRCEEVRMTIREVATRAGVSTATVSRVFAQPDAVAAETRQRVLTVAEEMGYTPHPVARSLARGRTGNLGIIVPDIANSFSALITKVVQQEAHRAGYSLFVAASDEVAEDEERAARAMAGQVDALLLVSPRMSDAELRELAGLVPLVAFDRLLDDIPVVLLDTTEAAGHAVEHLHALGHRDIVYLAGPPGCSNEMRQRGYRTACERLGLTAHELGPFPARFTAGVRAADLVLATAATAVVAYNDELAVGVLNRAIDRGLGVPHELSVVGFDDTGLAGMVNPRLTTVHLPAAEAGMSATHALLGLLDGRGHPRRSPLRLPAELVVRASTTHVPTRLNGRIPAT
jgi:DNA-binding LacI/PurR family transcriptional regulator